MGAFLCSGRSFYLLSGVRMGRSSAMAPRFNKIQSPNHCGRIGDQAWVRHFHVTVLTLPVHRQSLNLYRWFKADFCTSGSRELNPGASLASTLVSINSWGLSVPAFGKSGFSFRHTTPIELCSSKVRCSFLVVFHQKCSSELRHWHRNL